MNIAVDNAKRNKAHSLILKGLQAYDDTIKSEDFPFLENKIKGDKYHEVLTRKQVKDGCMAFVLLINIEGSSPSGNCELYRLLETYMFNPEKRVEINKILRQ